MRALKKEKKTRQRVEVQMNKDLSHLGEQLDELQRRYDALRKSTYALSTDVGDALKKEMHLREEEEEVRQESVAEKARLQSLKSFVSSSPFAIVACRLTYSAHRESAKRTV